ncbi:COMM domain-containing protein 6 [Elysia marginata]|uniref:COMM domain-containing protein 6 n=1 Tax=Elysia marginata TaxID=1093978 RepID=A0AAV4EWD5_9GAST|nr:COMM domain-containing protein 6 [Elysia marginata]
MRHNGELERKKGTRDGMFLLRTAAHQKDLYMCFIDYTKAFDRINHAKLMEVLTKAGAPDIERRLNAELYWSQTAQGSDLSLEWKVGLAVSSSEVRSLNEVVVTLNLITTDTGGSKVCRPVEMTLAQFRDFKKTVEDIHQQMENTKLL